MKKLFGILFIMLLFFSAYAIPKYEVQEPNSVKYNAIQSLEVSETIKGATFAIASFNMENIAYHVLGRGSNILGKSFTLNKFEFPAIYYLEVARDLKGYKYIKYNHIQSIEVVNQSKEISKKPYSTAYREDWQNLLNHKHTLLNSKYNQPTYARITAKDRKLLLARITTFQGEYLLVNRPKIIA